MEIDIGGEDRTSTVRSKDTFLRNLWAEEGLSIGDTSIHDDDFALSSGDEGFPPEDTDGDKWDREKLEALLEEEEEEEEGADGMGEDWVSLPRVTEPRIDTAWEAEGGENEEADGESQQEAYRESALRERERVTGKGDRRYIDAEAGAARSRGSGQKEVMAGQRRRARASRPSRADATAQRIRNGTVLTEDGEVRSGKPVPRNRTADPLGKRGKRFQRGTRRAKAGGQWGEVVGSDGRDCREDVQEFDGSYGKKLVADQAHVTELSAALQENAQLYDAIRSLEDELGVKHEECERLRSEMRKGKDTVAIAEEAERRNDALEQEIDVHRQAMEEKEEEMRHATRRIQRLSGILAGERKKRTELERELEEVCERNAALEDQVKKLKANKGALLAQIKSLKIATEDMETRMSVWMANGGRDPGQTSEGGKEAGGSGRIPVRAAAKEGKGVAQQRHSSRATAGSQGGSVRNSRSLSRPGRGVRSVKGERKQGGTRDGPPDPGESQRMEVMRHRIKQLKDQQPRRKNGRKSPHSSLLPSRRRREDTASSNESNEADGEEFLPQQDQQDEREVESLERRPLNESLSQRSSRGRANSASSDVESPGATIFVHDLRQRYRLFKAAQRGLRGSSGLTENAVTTSNFGRDEELNASAQTSYPSSGRRRQERAAEAAATVNRSMPVRDEVLERNRERQRLSWQSLASDSDEGNSDSGRRKQEMASRQEVASTSSVLASRYARMKALYDRVYKRK